MKSTLRIAFGAVALASVVACGPPDSVLLNDGYEVVRTEGSTSYLFKASTGDCVERTAYQGGVSYKRVPTEDC
ncbi:hypothetical protein RUE5091_04442 [Ruegeria denitrificans]|uniref:Lipoprotein n=1 Tax=Ruegeria denitrificans TaxID=1715692 RepID=A0A0P1J1G3_9RHOB|nr:hypothetical protein RUE5091_04442 [Ruegeria denitrificans]